MDNNSNLYEQACAVAQANLTECCKEIVEWRKKAILNDGYVRSMATLLEKVDSHNATRMAEDIVIDLALKKLAAGE